MDIQCFNGQKQEMEVLAELTDTLLKLNSCLRKLDVDVEHVSLYLNIQDFTYLVRILGQYPNSRHLKFYNPSVNVGCFALSGISFQSRGVE